MTQAHGRIQDPLVDEDPDEYSRIPWVETDPRRAPLRNDIISALQVGLSPSVFFFIFFTGYYPVRGAIAATVVMVAIATFVAFVFKWARMASARRRGATIRSPRRKLWVAAVAAIVIGVATVFTSGDVYTDRTTQALLAIAAGLAAAVILLVLESYALSVPAVDEMGRARDSEVHPVDYL